MHVPSAARCRPLPCSHFQDSFDKLLHLHRVQRCHSFSFGMAPSALLTQRGSQALGCRVIAGSRRSVVCRPSSAHSVIKCSNHAVRKTLEPVRAVAVSVFICIDNFVHDRAALVAHPRGSSVWWCQRSPPPPSFSGAMQGQTCITTVSLSTYQTCLAFS
jgi:hypothetical protein